MAARSSAYTQFYDQAGRMSYCLYLEGWADAPWDNGSGASATIHTAAWLYCTFNSTPFTSHWWTRQLYINGWMASDVYDANPTSSSQWSSCNVGINGTTYYRVFFIGEVTSTVNYNYNSTTSFESKVGINFGTNGSYMPVKQSYWATCYPTTDRLDKTCYFNLNIYDPDGVEQYWGDAGSIEISTDGGNSYQRVYNEPISYPYWGSTIYFRNVWPAAQYYLSSITGLSYWDGSWGYVTIAGDTEINLYMAWNSYWNDINAYQPDGSTQNGLIFNLTTSDGGSWSYISNEPENFTKRHGTTATISDVLPYVVGAHYTHNSVTGDNSRTFSWDFTQSNYIVHLYSAWNNYTIKYNKNGGTGEMADTSMTYNTAKNLSINTFTKTGCRFLGWSTTSDGAVEYTDGQSVNNLSSSDGGSVTLYAVWEYLPLGEVALTCTETTSSSITVAWTGAEDLATGYDFYVKRKGASSYKSVSLVSTATGRTLSGLPSGVEIEMYVVAKNGDSTSTSNTITAVTELPNAIITNLKAENITSNSCKITGSGELSNNIDCIDGGGSISSTGLGALSTYFSVEGKFKLDSDVSTMIVGMGPAAVGTATGSNLWHLDYMGGGVFRLYVGTKMGAVSMNGIYFPGRWNTFKIQRSGSIFRLTINGFTASLVSGFTGSYYGNTQPFRFGMDNISHFAGYFTISYAPSSASSQTKQTFTIASGSSLGGKVGYTTKDIPAVTYKYQFSKDNGETWTTPQTSNIYNWTNLEEYTEHQMGFKVVAYNSNTTNEQTTSTEGFYTIKTLAGQAKMFKKQLDEWQKGKTFIRINGKWIKAKSIYIKRNGKWEINSKEV